MPTPVRSIVHPRQILNTLRQHAVLWAVPAIAATILAAAYGLVRSPKWRASQTLIVRDEAGGSTTARHGRFDTSEAMKTAQETLVQMAHNPAVVKAALEDAGPPEGRTADQEWPKHDDVEELQDAITVSPPKGGEFGRNEVMYLSVTARSPERAVELTTAVCKQLELRMQELRTAKAQSLIAELEKTAALAEGDLQSATRQLEQIEKKAGRDLDELRSLAEPGSGAGGSNLRSNLNQLKDEIRRTQLTYDSTSEQLKLLTDAKEDVNRLMAAPQRLFEQHPALRRLKDGLVDAQLRTAQLVGKMRKDHPEVKAAQHGEDEVRQQLNQELDLVIKNLEADQKVSQALLRTLTAQLTEIEDRLRQVAALRPAYANQLAEVRQRGETVAKAEKDLADVRASQAAAQSASQITRLDAPDPGNGPVGPGFLVIVFGGAASGLILGLGLVFLTAPLGNLWGRRWTDYIGIGRRASDRDLAGAARPSGLPYGRRSTDGLAPSETKAK